MTLFLDGYENDEIKLRLMESPAFPLVREIVFKHGLRVVRQTNTGWLMCNQYGIAVGKANCTKNPEGVLEYTWRSPYYMKERGSDRADKETIHSAKLSSLMGVLKAKKVIPSAAIMVEKKMKMLGSPVRYLRRSLGDSGKNINTNADFVHALLAYYLHGETDSRGLSIDRSECKNLLDKCDNADSIKRMKDEKCDAFFHNPFYMVGVDEFGDYLIGKMRMVPTAVRDDPKVEVVEHFKRYKSIEDNPDLLAFMTMTKAVCENLGHPMIHGLPIMDAYDDSLNAVFFYDTRPTHYDHTYVVTPC
jgi:hypothetical protein